MRELDLSAIRARLATKSGPTYWRSLEELAETEEFTEFLHREFPVQASEFNDPAGRRQFLKLMGASLALAGAAGCTRQPTEMIVPYVRQPEEIIPGKPLFFATAMPHAGFATPLLVESHMGRPTKVEPNPEHPSTRGGTDVFSQGSILTLYDPDRSRTVRYRTEIRPFGEFATAVTGALTGQKTLQGAGFRLVTETITSPSLIAQIEALLQTMPSAKWIQYDAVSRDNVRMGARAALGRDVHTRYKIDQADVILSLDSDLFEQDPGRLRYSRDFADRRRLINGNTSLNRLYVVESRVSNTGSAADHRVAVKAGDVDAVARAVAAGIGVAGVSAGSLPKQVSAPWLDALVKDLQAHRGRSVVLVGEHQPASVHQLAHLMNAALGNVGATLEYTEPVEARPADQLAALRELTADMSAGKVDLLVILSANPVYTAPVDLKFTEAMAKVPLRVHLGLFDDETAEQCHWHIPESYYLEAWGDSRAFDGTITVQQPLIAPLYETKAPSEVIAALAGQATAESGALVKTFWEQQYGAKSGAFGPLNDPDGQAFASFDKFWRRALHDGYIAGSAFAPIAVAPAGAAPAAVEAGRADALEVTFSADPSIYDGRYANNGWLQETPKPFNKLTWDNAALVSPDDAKTLGLATTDVIEIRAQGRTVTAPVWVMPGQPAGSINLQLGYGRRRAGQVGNGVGFDAYAFRTTAAQWTIAGVEVQKTGSSYALASTQGHFNMEGRNLVRSGPLAEYQQEPEFAKHMGHRPPRELTLHNNEWKYEGYAWGMVIDLNVCNGCNACVVACTSENNIPVVGKQQVMNGREMHWIRIDRYYEGDPQTPTIYNQPVVCMQCENAPCEVVCPVAATTHSTEGLNDMVYNRCVGTRYCSNNCPYKVRRFNFLLYQDWTTPTLKMARNPDVTVRSRGVMEKCTYCVQRINTARIQSKLEDRQIRDGEIQTACQTACATQAITFGNINDPESRVAKLKKEPREYGVLEDLNTRPRTTYLAVVRNPNPEIAPAAGGHGEATTHGETAAPAATPHQ
jgi:molybdopterin-containing oxidoreductase family iron-sulfur binding subunit